MAIYQWKGIQGSQLTNGEIEAFNQDDATKKLQAQKIVVTNLVLISGKEQEGSSTGAVSSKKNNEPIVPKVGYKTKKIKNIELMIFTKKLATMVEAGLPINKTLKMLEEQQVNLNFKRVVGTIRDFVEQGTPLSTAFEAFPRIFDNIFINMIRAGETSGKLTEFLKKTVIHLEKSEKIRRKVKGALTYPVVLLIVASAAIAVMMIFVVPVFQGMFEGLGGELPGPTKLIVTISDFLRNPMGGGMLLLGIIGTITGIKYLNKNNKNFKKKFDTYMLKAPLIGSIIEKATLSRIAMVQANLSMAGVPITEALNIVSRSISNSVFIEAFDDIKEGIASGNSLSSLYATNSLFPPTFHQMLAVGEETGKMDEMLVSTANYYEEEFDMAVSKLTESLEPIMIIGMGLTIGFIIVAMYMPIFKIGEAFMG